MTGLFLLEVLIQCLEPKPEIYRVVQQVLELAQESSQPPQWKDYIMSLEFMSKEDSHMCQMIEQSPTFSGLFDRGVSGAVESIAVLRLLIAVVNGFSNAMRVMVPSISSFVGRMLLDSNERVLIAVCDFLRLLAKNDEGMVRDLDFEEDEVIEAVLDLPDPCRDMEAATNKVLTFINWSREEAQKALVKTNGFVEGVISKLVTAHKTFGLALFISRARKCLLANDYDRLREAAVEVLKEEDTVKRHQNQVILGQYVERPLHFVTIMLVDGAQIDFDRVRTALASALIAK